MEPTTSSSAQDDIARPPEIPDPPPARARRRYLPVVLVAIGGVVLASSLLVAVFAPPEESETAAPATAAATAAMPLPPVNLEARASAFRVRLTWEPGGGGDSQDYVVYRSGELVGVAEAKTPRFLDEEALPDTRYRYVVKASGGDYGAESAGAAIWVKTSPASPALARLAGIFAVKLHVDSSYSLTGVVGGTAAWRLVPKCSYGPCASRIIDVNGPMPAIDLRRTAAVYDGTASGKTGYRCGSLPISGTFHAHLRVTEAGNVGGRWRAKEMEGTITISMPQALGCRSGGITYDVNATLQEAS